MEMKHRKLPTTKDMRPEEFKNNDYLLRMAEELNRDGAGIVLGTLDDLINWGRSNSVWSLALGTSCCAIEFMALGALSTIAWRPCSSGSTTRWPSRNT